MTDDMREVFDKGLAQAFPDEGKPAESEWSRVADADDATDAEAAKRARTYAQGLRDAWEALFKGGSSYLREMMRAEGADIGPVSVDESQPIPARFYPGTDRFTTEDIEAQQELLDSWKAQGRLWGSIRYADVQSLLDEVKASRASAPNAEHATMAEAVAAVTSASLTLARIERKVDALGKPPCASVTVPFDIIFDGPPGPEAGRFVEVERDGVSINAGAWRKREDGLWALRIDYVADWQLLRGLADDVQRDASAVGIRATPDAGSPDDTPANRIRNVVAQLVERLRPVTPLPAPSADMIELGQRAAKVAFGTSFGVSDWWQTDIGHDAEHALTHDDAPALRPNERPGDEWETDSWIAFRDAVRRLPRKVDAPAETPAP